MLLVIKYPPDFDGETHIHATSQGSDYHFEFSQASKGSAIETLVSVAKDILRQWGKESPEGEI